MDPMADTPGSAAHDPGTTATVVRALGDVVVSVEAAIARVQSGDAPNGLVGRVLDAAEAPDLGDVVARHNALIRAVAIVEQRGSLPDGEWAAVAGQGADLAVAVDRLRSRAGGLLDAASVPGADREDDDTSDDDPAAGTAALVTAATDGLLGETLQVLVLTEGCLAAWHRVRIARAAVADRPAAVADARALLADHLTHDGELLRRGRRVLARAAAATPLETVRRLSSARTVRTLGQLRRDLDDFRSACGADAAGWLDGEDPAVEADLAAVGNPLRVVGDVFGRGLARVTDARRRGDDGTEPDAAEPDAAEPDTAGQDAGGDEHRASKA